MTRGPLTGSLSRIAGCPPSERKEGWAKDEILEHIGLMGRHKFCFDDDPPPGSDPPPGDDQIPEDDWRMGIAEDLRGHESLKSYKVVEAGTKNDKGEDIPEVKLVEVPETLIKSHINQQPLIGSKIVKPKDDASEEEWDKFYESLGMGRPESPEKYELTADEKFASLPHSDTMEQWFRDIAYKKRIPQEVANEIYQGYQEQQLGIFQGAEEEMNNENDKATEALQKKWGDKEQENTILADRVFHTLFPFDENEKDGEGKPTAAARTKFLLRALLGNNPHFIEAMYNLAPVYGEDRLAVVDEGAAGPGGKKSREDLKKMMADRKYGTDEEYTKQVDEAYKQAFPD